MAVLEALEARRDFTRTDDTLADYILEHADEVVRMSTSELSKRAYVSGAAINRLCHKVGSDGFREFKVDLNTELERRRTGTDVSANLSVSSGQSTITTMADLRNVFQKAMDASFATTSAMDVHAAARAILRSGRVIMYGAGDSAVACEQFANDLEKIGVASVAGYRYAGFWAATRLAKKGDVALFVTYSGRLLDGLADHLPALRKAGVTIIVVTSGELSPAHKALCDHVLTLPKGEDIVNSVGTFFSQMCVHYALSSVYATAFAIDAESTEAHRSSVVSADWTR